MVLIHKIFCFFNKNIFKIQESISFILVRSFNMHALTKQYTFLLVKSDENCDICTVAIWTNKLAMFL